MTRKTFACLLAVTLLFSAVALLSRRDGNIGATLADLSGVTGIAVPGGADYTIRENEVRGEGENSTRSVDAVSGKRRLKIEVISGIGRKEAEKTMEDRMQMIRSLFANLPSPYPGMVAGTVAVPDEVSPRMRMVTLSGTSLQLTILASNSRYTYGAMPVDLVAFRGGLLFYYEPQRGTLYRFDFFVPVEEFDEEELAAFFEGIHPVLGTTEAPDSAPGIQSPGKEARGESASQETDSMAAGPDFEGYNLILIAVEPLGARHVSSYGYSRRTTPNLDAFAADAILFENAVSPSSWSLPAFMSWFTSLYPSQHRLTNKYSEYDDARQVLARLPELSPDAVTLTQVLRRNGYRTAAFTGGASLAGAFGFNLGFEQYHDGKDFEGFNSLMPQALSWMAEKRNEKFFVFLQGYDVHGRFPFDKAALRKFLGADYRGPFTGIADEYWNLRNRSIGEGDFSMAEEDVRFWKAVYDAKIFSFDERFGGFVHQLEALGLLEKSIIIVSAGSGNEHFEHGRIDHGFSLYEELVHVPLIIRIPHQHGRIEPLVRTIDIMPTIVDLLALDVEPGVRRQMQGVSLVPLLEGEQLSLDGIAETDYLLHTFKRSIRTSDGWKLIVTLDTEERELFLLDEDPEERKNLVQEQGRRAYEMEQQLFRELRKNPLER